MSAMCSFILTDLGIPVTTRARDLCSDDSKRQAKLNKLHKIFRANGYPDRFIEKAIAPNPTAAADMTTAEPPAYVSVPYVKGVSERIQRVLAPLNIRVAHQSKPTLKNLLVKIKDPIPAQDQKGVVYKIPCGCSQVYVGETGRPRSVRMKEHKADIRHRRYDKSAVATHMGECQHGIMINEVTTVGKERQWNRRIIREAIEIGVHHATINKDKGKHLLSPTWWSVLPARGSQNPFNSNRSGVQASHHNPHH